MKKILTLAQAAEAKDASIIPATSQAHNSDSGEMSDRPNKRLRITREPEGGDHRERTDASRQAVLQTNELLEAVLALLPPKQLFVDQRVCKQWRDVIASSPELQRMMFLRVDEIPRQIWGLRDDYLNPDASERYEMRRFDNGPLSREWQGVTPVILSPHLTTIEEDEESVKNSIYFWPPCNVDIESHSSIFDTYFCNPPCYGFALRLDFMFEPAIPGHGHLFVNFVQFQTGKSLKVGEALDKAMAIRTNARLGRDYRDEGSKAQTYRNCTVTEIIDELQREYRCAAILCESSLMGLENVFVPDEQRQKEVDAAYAKTGIRTG